MPASDDRPTPPQIAKRRSDDDALLADLNAPPTIDEARESHEYWQRRSSQLPLHRRAERKEAAEMAARWKERLAAAEREEYGPGLTEQVLEMLGIRWRPNPGRLVAGVGLLAVLLLIVLVVLIVAIVVFWPELEPIARTLIGNGNGNGEGGG
jgi:hypothetical protein